jgi:L-asparaginase II
VFTHSNVGPLVIENGADGVRCQRRSENGVILAV